MEIQKISFAGYKRKSTKAIQCVIKTCFKEGLFGDKVQFDIFGNRLTRKVTESNRVYSNVSAEHVIAASKGGTFMALSTRSANKQKGSKDIWEVLTNRTEDGRNKILAVLNYFKQFEGIKIDTFDSKGQHIYFDGDTYIKNGRDVLRKVGIVPGEPDADIKIKNIKTIKTKAKRCTTSQCRK